MNQYLTKIKEPSDLKQLSQEEMKLLALEIRKELLKTLSQTGGHLGPNLGVVELTIALHYCFNTPKDKIIWDVGHQTYVHKLLTGRLDRFSTVRQFEGLSGFPKRAESQYDAFDTGHSSTSISAALGYAVARNINQEDYYVMAVIGDGALSGGMAFEALNNAARLKENFIIIINDNQMSIAENVGGLSLYLDKIRTDSMYNEMKEDVQKVLRKIPRIGDELIQTMRDFKDSIKQLVIPGMFFEEMGYTYLGPVDGHNFKQLILTFNQAKKVEGPVIIHLNTIKGKGYKIAEVHPERFHGTGPFDIKSGETTIDCALPSYSKVFGKKILELGERNTKVVAITAAMPSGTGLNYFADVYPKRFFDVGIAEQHALTFAAGLAAAGQKPYVALYSSFLQRGYDQVVHDIATQQLNVTICVDRAGIVGDDGETHQGVFDVSFLNHIPNMTILAPKNTAELELCLDFSLEFQEGPLVIRYPRGTDHDFNKHQGTPLEYGRFDYLERGNKIAVVFNGNFYQLACEITSELSALGYTPTLINSRFIKPIDIEGLKALAENHDDLLVIEENAVIGGMGSEILRTVNDLQLNIKVHLRGIEDHFVPQGKREQLLKACQLDKHSIIKWFLSRIEV